MLKQNQSRVSFLWPNSIDLCEYLWLEIYWASKETRRKKKSMPSIWRLLNKHICFSVLFSDRIVNKVIWKNQTIQARSWLCSLLSSVALIKANYLMTCIFYFLSLPSRPVPLFSLTPPHSGAKSSPITVFLALHTSLVLQVKTRWSIV